MTILNNGQSQLNQVAEASAYTWQQYSNDTYLLVTDNDDEFALDQNDEYVTLTDGNSDVVVSVNVHAYMPILAATVIDAVLESESPA